MLEFACGDLSYGCLASAGSPRRSPLALSPSVVSNVEEAGAGLGSRRSVQAHFSL